MSLTLGLSTALSGLTTAQRGLDVVSQNVVNLNTKGYTRKVMNPESRVLAGFGAGVQTGSVTRMVNEGLLKDIRRQTTITGKLEVEQNYYPRIDDLFGEVGDATSIAHRINDLFTAFQTLAGSPNKPSVQWSTMQSAQDVASQLSSMTRSLQDLRVQADREIEESVDAINTMLNSIHDLNQKIVKNSAIATGTTDLEDKRDQLLTDLAKELDIQYFKRADGAITIFSNSGQMLLDNQPQPLSYTASSTTDTWMTKASGQFNPITVQGGSQDFGSEITGGKLRALLDMRDTTIPNLQSGLDEMAGQMRDALNRVHNRGTSLPNLSSRYEGSRTFALQGNIVPNAADTAAVIYQGSTSIPPATYGSLSFAANALNPWQTTLTATAGAPFNAANFGVGKTFSITSAEDSANNGTYRVVGYNSASEIVVEKVNLRQTMQLGGTDDVVIATFDKDGNQLKQTTLNEIMQMDFSGLYTSATVGTNRSLSDFGSKGDHDQWAINEVSAHVEAWLRSQGYNNASVNLNAEGKMIVDVGDASVGLVFRDQTSSTPGAEQTDATISFDVNGDGAMDQTIKGFSNFFGLNDLYINPSDRSIQDSAIKSSSYTTTANRDLSLYDETGKLGNTLSIPKGTSLEKIAEMINTQTRTTDSAVLTNTTWQLTSPATISISDSSGSVASVTLPPGTYTMEEIAGRLTQGTVTGSVVQDGAGSRLRLTDSRGQPLSVAITGGTVAGSSMSLGQTLEMTPRQPVHASVVPEGSGYRLRIRQTEGGEVWASSTLDINNNNLLTDLGLEPARTGTAADLAVRADIQLGPEKISRGTMQWNADLNTYYLSEGDNSVALELSKAMTTKVTVNSAGSIASGKYTFAEYAASTISVVAVASANSQSQLDYQSKLNDSLAFQNASFSGVNLDEEISAMMDFQQAYSASAKVITVMQEMLETLTSMIR